MTSVPTQIPNPQRVVDASLAIVGIPKLFDDVATLLADDTTGYYPLSSLPPSQITKPSLVEGSFVQTRSEGFKFEVAADDATDHDVETAGGVKLYALPDANGILDVRQFGCVAGSDSAVQLQKALSHPNLKISIPKLDDPFIVQSSLTCAVNEKQILGGWIKEKTGVILEPIITISGDNTLVDGLMIEGSQETPGGSPSDQNKAAILVDGDYCTITNCSGGGKTTMVRTNGSYGRFALNSFSGFGSSSSAQNQLFSIRGEHHSIIGNQLHNSGSGVTCGATVNNTTISGNVISGTRDNGVYVSSGVNCVVSNNVLFDTFGSTAIKIRGFGNVVSGNTVKNHAGSQGGPAINVTPIAAAYANSQETYFVEFESGSSNLRAGDIVTGATSGATGSVSNIWLKDGSYEEGDATGFIVFYARNGTAFVADEVLTVSSVDVANVTSVPKIGANGNVISNNTVDGCDGYGIWITSDTDGAGVPYRQQGVSCCNNTVTNAGRGADDPAKGASGGISLTAMFNCEVVGNTIIGVDDGSLGAFVFNLSEGFDISHNTVVCQIPCVYIIKSAGLRFSHNTFRGGFTAVRITSNVSPGVSDAIVFNHNTIYGNVQTEQGNFVFSDGNVLYGGIDADSLNLGTQDYFEIQRNTLIRPNASVRAVEINILGQSAKIVDRILITDNVFDCRTTVIQISPYADETSTDNAVIRQLDLSRNIITTNTTVKAIRITAGAEYKCKIERMILEGGSCVNLRGFLETNVDPSGSLIISGYRYRGSSSSYVHTPCDITGFDTVLIDGCDFGSDTIINGPMSINCTGRLTVSKNKLRNMGSSGITPGANVTTLYWIDNEVSGVTLTDILGRITGSTRLVQSGISYFTPQPADPQDPPAGHAIEWVSDGTGTGDAGDVLMRVNIGGTVKTKVVFDYSEES